MDVSSAALLALSTNTQWTPRSNYNSTSLAAAVNNLGTVVREAVIGPDQIAGLVARNKRFARLQLSEDVMIALILLKLPDKYATIKTMIIQSDKLPTVKVFAPPAATAPRAQGARWGKSARV